MSKNGQIAYGRFESFSSAPRMTDPIQLPEGTGEMAEKCFAMRQVGVA
jgi:hypothetical protein